MTIITKLPGFMIDDTANFVFANVTITGNVQANNANLGNAATANFFIGNGSLLTGLPASYANSDVANYLPTYTGNLSAGNANLGNLVIANFFSGSGNLLSNIAGANVSGFVANANVANVAYSVSGSNVTGEVANAGYANIAGTANSVAGANVSGQVGNALIAGTVYTNAQPNITSVGTLTSLDITGNISAGNANLGNAVTANFFIGDGSLLTGVANSSSSNTVISNAQPNITSVGTLTSLIVSGNVNFNGSNVSLGNVSNLKITGGAANYFLKTDGNGNLIWSDVTTTSAAVPTNIAVDTFTANGNSNAFTLTSTPESEALTIVHVDGVYQLKESYSLSGNILTFGSTPIANSVIEISTIVPGTTGSISSLANGSSNVSLALNSNITFGVAGTANVVTISNTQVTTIGNIIPSASNTYSLGSETNRWNNLYLAGNTIYLGNSTFSETDILPFNLTIAPEVLTINVDAPFAGNDIQWLFTWTQSTLPYARQSITNQQQINVPLYRQGTYQVNNFANEIHGNMDQRHNLYLKWVDGAGTDNLVSWAVSAGNVTMSHPDINGGANTVVQRYNITVPSTVTIPTLNLPSNVQYNVSFANVGAYTIGGSGIGENRNIGPLYRGATYTFNLDSSLANHPFYITTDNGTGFVANTYVGEYTTGVTGSRGNGASGYNTLTFVVPNDAPDVLYYQCAFHSSMRGAITIKDLAVETNINGNPILYFQHGKEGHKTPVEIRPIPSMVNQMCLVYDATTGQFVPQDLATYVENTPSFFNKIQEVAGTATLIAPDGAVVVPTVLVVEDVSYLPLVDNNDGDLAFDAYTDTIYVWETNSWRTTKPSTVPTVTSNAQPNITSVGTLTSLTVSGNSNIAGNLTVSGNLTVTGTTTTINSTIVTINDKAVVLANNAANANDANGSGIIINGANANLLYSNVQNAFVSSHSLMPISNVELDLGSANYRWKDLYLSGNTIDLAGAKIQADANSGAIAIIPQVTQTTPNPTAFIISPTGAISTANTTAGSITESAISNASSNAAAVQTFGTISLSQTGNVPSTFTGVARFYPTSNLTIVNVFASLGTVSTANLGFMIKKNGSNVGTFTVSSSSFRMNAVSANISLTTSDYLTLDITSGSGATDLKVDLQYRLQ